MSWADPGRLLRQRFPMSRQSSLDTLLKEHHPSKRAVCVWRHYFSPQITRVNLCSRIVESEHLAQQFLFLVPKAAAFLNADLVTQLQKKASCAFHSVCPDSNLYLDRFTTTFWTYLSVFLLWMKLGKVLHYLLQKITWLLNFSWSFIVNSKNYGQDWYELFLFYPLCSSA